MPAAPYNGKCLCGAVSVAISSEPAAVITCFCEHCYKGAGGANQVIGKFAHNDVQITAGEDKIAKYVLGNTSSGSPKEKHFCPQCGVTLWTIPAAAQGKYRMVRTAILDNGLELRPGVEIFVKNRPTWMSPTVGAEQWEEARK